MRPRPAMWAKPRWKTRRSGALKNRNLINAGVRRRSPRPAALASLQKVRELNCRLRGSAGSHCTWRDWPRRGGGPCHGTQSWYAAR